MRHRLLALTVVALALTAAACGSAAARTSSASPPATSAHSSAPARSGAQVAIGTESSPYGTILESDGDTLYALSSDTATSSKCTTSACVAAWPPLSTAGTPTAGGAVKASLLGRLTRPGGAQQVSYGGHPLYFFSGDTKAGQTNGQGITNFGGTWHVVAASNAQPVTTAPSSSSGPATTSTTTGYGGY